MSLIRMISWRRDRTNSVKKATHESAIIHKYYFEFKEAKSEKRKEKRENRFTVRRRSSI